MAIASQVALAAGTARELSKIFANDFNDDAPVAAGAPIAVENGANGALLEGITRGDRIDITRTEALLAAVTRAK